MKRPGGRVSSHRPALVRSQLAMCLPSYLDFMTLVPIIDLKMGQRQI